MKLKLALLCGLALAGGHAMACYTVYDAHNRVAYRGVDAPVDMSDARLNDRVVQRFGRGASMVFAEGATCAPVGMTQVARPESNDVPLNTMRLERSGRVIHRKSEAPLFTDRQTADMSGLPHTVVAGDIVMVPPSAADRAITPTVTVLPTPTAVAQAARADTTAMGAGPDTRTLGAGPATITAPAPVGRRQVVITELRDPPVTIVQNGGTISITPAGQ